jgi:hypothetical protein
MTDPLDLITWPQFRAAFQIAALALTEIEGAAEDPLIVATATDALRAMQAEVGRFDISEPSWDPAATRS